MSAELVATTGSREAIADTAADERSSILEIFNVGKVFGNPVTGHHALIDVNISIEEGEFFTLLGPSGCGKTTLLRIIAGFEQVTSGSLILRGQDVAGTPPQKRRVNMVFQNYALFPHLNVEENVAFGLQMLNWSAPEIKDRVANVLQLVRLTEFKTRKPNQLSGGQQQRVALARALAPRPELLLLDEPLSALDLKLRKEMQVELRRLRQETGITFILVTHDQEEALAMSDRIAVMNDGRVQQIGSPREIYDRPKNRFVADFIGEANIFPAEQLGRGTGYMALLQKS